MPKEDKTENATEIINKIELIFRRKYLFLVIFISITLLSIVYSYIAKKMYKSSAIILVEKEKIINPLMRGLAVSQTESDRLKTIRELILSRSRLLNVIKKLDLDINVKTPLELEGLINTIRSSISINIIGKNLYRISYEGDKPETTRDVANTICNLFIEENLGAFRGAANDAYTFIENQLETYKKKLEDSENALRLFKEKNLGQLPGQENVNLSKLEKYRNLLDEAESEFKEAKLQKRLLEKQLKMEKPLIVFFSSSDNDSTLNNDPLEDQLAKLNSQLNFLLTKYTDNYPDVIYMKRQIDEIKQKLSAEGKNKTENKKNTGTQTTTETWNPIFSQLKEDLSGVEIRINILESRIKEYREKVEFYDNAVKSIPVQEQELASLQRGYDVNLQIYKTLLNKLEEARISRELELGEKGDYFQIIDSAQLPLIPSKPKRPLIIFLGMALGLIGGFAFIYILDSLDNSIASLDDARKSFSYPILVGIPIIRTHEDIKKKRIANLLFFTVIGTFIASIMLLIIKESNLNFMLKRLFSEYLFFR